MSPFDTPQAQLRQKIQDEGFGEGRQLLLAKLAGVKRNTLTAFLKGEDLSAPTVKKIRNAFSTMTHEDISEGEQEQIFGRIEGLTDMLTPPASPTTFVGYSNATEDGLSRDIASCSLIVVTLLGYNPENHPLTTRFSYEDRMQILRDIKYKDQPIFPAD